jgi:hypothetical protein
MKVKNILAVIVLLFTGFITLISGSGCANIIPPSGGPRDSLPPLLLGVTPADSTRNFKDNRIVFDFDEYIEVQNVQENVLVSPVPQINPYIESKLKTVTVRLKDSLEPNTTYSINFGNAIKDFNEGNVLKNFTYVFSTGPAIDSMQLTGNVILAETGKIDTTIIVMLHTSFEDSAIIKERPRYIARLDNQGKFTFNNLPPDTFALYALKDVGGSHRYMSKTQLFAFADTPVNLRQQTQPITLYAYVKEEAKPVTSAATATNTKGANKDQDKRLKFSTNVSGAPLDLFSNLELNFEQPLKTLDTNLVRLYSDSAFTPVDGYAIIPDSSRKLVTVKAPWVENKEYHLILDQAFAEDSLGKKLLRNDTLNFFTRKATDYGSVRIRFRNLGNYTNPVLQFVQNDVITNSFPLLSDNFFRAMFLPGDYELRILNDENKNGVWDPGNFFGKRLQPEIVKPIERKLNIKPNWENEFEIEAPAAH